MYFRVREKEDDVHSNVVSNIPRQWCLHSHDALEETFSLAAECVLHQMYPAILVLIHEMLGRHGPFPATLIRVKIAINIEYWSSHGGVIGLTKVRQAELAMLFFQESCRLVLLEPHLHAGHGVLRRHVVPQSVTCHDQKVGMFATQTYFWSR